jgi:autophagy-related protein 9
MMASNLVSRILPRGNGSQSIYETLRQHDESSDESDIEQRAGITLDEENLGKPYTDFDPEDVRLNASQVTTRSPKNNNRKMQGARMKLHGNIEIEEADDEVPASLLIENNRSGTSPQRLNRPPPTGIADRPIPISGPATRATRAQWEATQAHHQLHPGRHPRRAGPTRQSPEPRGLVFADPQQKAMWRWANVENLDTFLSEVYEYFLGNGFWSIMLRRALQLISSAFVAGFTFFLSNCINYDKVRRSNSMAQILVPKCTVRMSGAANLALWFLSLLWILKLFQYLLDIRRLRNMQDFYQHLLGVSGPEIQSISWQDIVSRLMALRDANPTTAAVLPAKTRRFLGSQSKQRMDAHDIANRLMRKENYLIALFNKDILDLTLPLPFIGRRQLFSRTLEWNINQCVIDFVFNEHGQVKSLFIKDTHRKELSDALRRRFLFAGTVNIIVAPILVAYFVVHYFFSYFTEYQRNPSQIGSRQYNPLAEWKFREFNELWHLFQKRINMSYPFASRYIDQFPKDKTVQLARFVAFVTGALAAVLAVASVIDPELFLNFEITKDRSVIFYLGVFGSIWAVARGMLPEENLVYEPDFALQEVIEFIHYKPAHWEGRLHSDEVRKEFATLYQLKLVIFLQEILSMIFTPFVLLFSLSNCSDRIVDFFREFSVAVDGLGYICSFAEFSNAMKQQTNLKLAAQSKLAADANPPTAALREDYYATKDQKLEASYWGFMNDYARNPKTDIRFPYANSRRRLNPPPPFPGLMSPIIPAEERSHTFTIPRHDPSDRSILTRNSPRAALVHGSPDGGPNQVSTPLMSILLDPHHQPAASGIAQPVISPQSRRRPPRRHHIPIAPDLVEAEEAEVNVQQAAQHGAESSGEGTLGSSWKIDQNDDSSDEEEDVNAVIGDRGAGGVLGMIKQFQKAQGEGRGTA